MSFALLFDGLALCILLFFCVRGMFKGFLSELIGFIGFFASLYCAWNFYDLLAEPMMEWFPNLAPNIVDLICGAAIFLGLSLLFALINFALSTVLNLAGLSLIDHALGTVVGAAKTFAILIVIYGTCMTFSAIVPTAWMSESYAMRIVSVTWPPVQSFLKKYNLIDSSEVTVTNITVASPSPLSSNRSAQSAPSAANTDEAHPATDVILAVPDTSAGVLSERELKELFGQQD